MEEAQKTPRGEKKEFPLTALIVAEEVARAVNGAGGKINSKAISASLGNIKGGALARKIAAAKRWGLIKGAGMLEITQLGKKIIHHVSEEELSQSRKEAFLGVPLFSNLYQRFGANPPVDSAFIAILVREHELSERDAKTMLTIYKEAIKFYLGANTEGTNDPIPNRTQPIPQQVKPVKKDNGIVSIYLSSPMGENNLKADNKEELKAMKTKLEKLFSLIEDELPEQEINNHTGPTAEEPTPILSSEVSRDNSEVAN